MTEPIFDTASLDRPLRIGVTCCYEHITKDGYLFKNMVVDNGHNSLKPFCDLYAFGQANGIDFVTLDQVQDMQAELDAVVFLDRHKPGQVLNEAVLQTNLVKILIIYECPLIKPDNWEAAYHQHFDYIFTWNDELVDGRRYIKNNFVTDLKPSCDFDAIQTTFAQRKLVTMINSFVSPQDPQNYPSELYTHRIRTIKWLEANAPDDFDLYGMGWDSKLFPSYKGKVADKHATFARYRFAICYENAQGYAGYISEKIQDCLLAGLVPVYGGAPNIAQWIPPDCYIDINQFSTYTDLHNFLASMDAATHGRYLNNIHNFLESPKAYPFSTDCFIATLSSYLRHGIAARHGHVTHWLQQSKDTLQLSLVPKPNPTLTALESINQLQAPNLVVAIGYGPELPVFLRARALWQWYASYFPNIQIIFFRGNGALPLGEVENDGQDLVIGLGAKGGSPDGHLAKNSDYATSGMWSASENENTIQRQMLLYDYLLASNKAPFHLFTTTITSIIDFRGLAALMNVIPRERCFAGMPGKLFHAPYQGVGIVHGANTLVSDDVMRLMRARHVPGHEFTKQPNDHWQGLVLPDVERTPLPIFSFNLPRKVDDDFSDVYKLTQKMLVDGHYHFRIKTTSAEIGNGKREDIDPWIMLNVMRAILGSTPSRDNNLDLQRRFTEACNVSNAVQRNFPINDAEALLF